MLLGGNIYQSFLAVAVLTMAATPFIIALAPRLADQVLRLPLPQRLRAGLYPAPTPAGAAHKELLRDHLIIVGFGLNGRNVTRAANTAGIATVLAIRRDSQLLPNPAAETVLEAGDVLVVLGEPDKIARAADLITACGSTSFPKRRWGKV